jgi:lysophospholipase L1-like esterase
MPVSKHARSLSVLGLIALVACGGGNTAATDGAAATATGGAAATATAGTTAIATGNAGTTAGDSTDIPESSGANAAGIGGATTSGSTAMGAASFTLAVIGSSTAEGEGASRPANAWTALLTRSLAARTNFTLRNLAVGGYTTADLLPDSDSTGNMKDAIATQPDLIVVALAGSNDLSIGTSSSTFMSRLTLLRDDAKAAGIPTFFVTTAPKDLSDSERQTLADWASSMRQSFASCWVPGTASPYTPCLIDIFDALSTSSLELASQFDSGDGIHLDDAGHAVVFRTAEPVLEAYVCSVAACH